MKNNKSHKYFLGTKDFSHNYSPKVGILLVNLGTPDHPTTKHVRVYLREFLNDSRIIEIPRWLWKIILEGIILWTRPQRVAKLYKSIWTEGGSPLLVFTKALAMKTDIAATKKYGSQVKVSFGMRYGNPSVSSALRELKDQGCTRFIYLPLFGQYSATTVGSAYDALADELKKWRWVPDIRTINQFHDHPAYIKCLADNIRNHWAVKGRSDKLLMSFHGVPLRYVLAGDPYHCHCHKTARLVAEELGLSKEEYVVSFQSQFGKEEWVKPATDKVIEGLAKSGLKSLDVICPGFICDCLETLEEIEEENKEVFLHNGGEKFSYIHSINDSDAFATALLEICKDSLTGWASEDLESALPKLKEEGEKTDKIFNERMCLKEQAFY